MTLNQGTESTRRFADYFLIGFFFFLLVLPMVTHVGQFFDQQYIRSQEKRNPAELPAIPDSFSGLQGYFAGINDYLNDHFGFRSGLITASNYLYLKVGVVHSDRVIKGKGEWLYYNSENLPDKYRGTNHFSPESLRDWIAGMEARQAWLAARDIPFLVVVAPNKYTVYPEYLPDWLQRLYPSHLEQLAEAMVNGIDLNVLDLRPVLFAEKHEALVYYKTDSHWNSRGAFVAYTEILHRMQRFFPAAWPLSEDDFTIQLEDRRGGDLGNMLNLAKYLDDRGWRYAPRFESRIRTIRRLAADGSLVEASQETIYDNSVTSLVESDRPDMPRVLIIRDSYSNALMPFFNETFQNCLYTYHWQGFPSSVIESFRPDMVLCILVERSFAGTAVLAKEF